MTKKQILRKYFNQKERLTIKNRDYLRQVKFFTDFFLSEDLAGEGDITTNLTIKQNKKVKAQITAKESGILAGLEEIEWLLTTYNLLLITYKKDSRQIKRGDKLISITGGIKDILKLERTALNILSRMSGIATQTNKLVKKSKGKALICPTRKTQWGLLDKKAVTLGGGGTHRLGLYDFVLIKDNHLANIHNSKFIIPNSFWEIEADTPAQAKKFSKLNPGAIMLDNFSPLQIKKTIPKLNPKIIIEASGGINESNIAEYAKTGVDVISLGALTHSTKALDVSLELKHNNH